jgi:hypothetical protein
MGDLNYRIDLARSEVESALREQGEEDLQRLRGSDQVRGGWLPGRGDE